MIAQGALGESLPGERGGAPRSVAPGTSLAAFGSATERIALRERLMNLLVSTLASDERLVPAASHLVYGLRPHLLAAARPDGGFFADRQHPWREVLVALTQRAMMWPITHRRGLERFLQPLADCVNEIRQRAPGSEAAAVRALAALRCERGRWHDGAERSRAMTVLGNAECRNVVARSVAADLGLRPDFAGAPAVLKRFLVGPWSQVMAAALLLDIGEPDPGNHAQTADDLLWSVRSGAAAPDPARLAGILPRMVANLRRGLRSIDHPQGDTTAFLQWLGAWYRPALPSVGDLAVLGAADPYQAVSAPAVDSAIQPWLTPHEACSAHLLDAAGLRAQFPRVPIEGLDLPATALRAAGGLTSGGIVEVCRRGRRERWAVEWASRYAVLFLFSDAAGRLRSLKAPALASLMRAGAARIVCRELMVDATLDSLAQVALRTSLGEPVSGDMARVSHREIRTIAAAARQEH